MATHSSTAAHLGTAAIIRSLVLHLQAKGLINDDEWTAIVNGAVQHVLTNDDGHAAVEFIKEFVGPRS